MTSFLIDPTQPYREVPSWVPDSPPPVAFVAEAPAQGEVDMCETAKDLGRAIPGPLVGPTGLYVHDPLCRQAGIERWGCFHGNVFGFKNWKGSKLPWKEMSLEAGEFREIWKRESLMPDTGGGIPLALWGVVERVVKTPVEGRHLRPELWGELVRLYEELRAANPKVLVGLGNYAAWALLGQTGIGRLYNQWTESILRREDGTPFPVIVTYHPSNGLKGQGAIPGAKDIILGAYRKARERTEEEGAEPEEIIGWVPESLGELRELVEKYLEPFDLLACDIETNDIEDRPPGWTKWKNEGREPWPYVHDEDNLVVKTIQFCGDEVNSVVIPFWNPEKERGCHWEFENTHLEVVLEIQRIFDEKGLVFQRGFAYDVLVLWKTLGLNVRGYEEDTILAGAAEDRGLRKGLHDLAARKVDFSPWKGERMKGKKEE